MSIILRAATLARQAHEGQFRKYSRTPYVLHPARVASRVALLADATEEMVAAAFLHDVVEDTSTTIEDITEATNEHVGLLVGWMTNPSKVYPEFPRNERKRMDREHLSQAPPDVKLIKMIDRIDNLNEMSGADMDFRLKYAEESVLLASVIGHAHGGLCTELLEAAERLKKV